MKQPIIAMMASALLASCGQNPSADSGNVIDKSDFKPVDRTYTSEVLEAFGRVSAPCVSPDGTKVLYGVSYESVEENKSNLDLYVMNTDGSEAQRLTATPGSENGAVWIDGGERIAFISPVDGQPQLWVMNADGSGRKAVSSVEGGIGGFLFAPDGKHVVLIANVKYARTAKDTYPDLPMATGRIIDDLMYKHWDEWVTEVPHPFIGKFDGDRLTDVADIMADEPYEAPMKPFGGIESFAWSPDSKKLVYVSRKKTGMEYALSTNSDLYLYDLDNSTTTNLTDGMEGYDTQPAFSPDGTTLAWLSMEHDGYESDKNRIFTLDLATGKKTDLTIDWDYTADAIAWNPDSKSIYFIAPKDGVTPIFSISTATREVSVVAEGQYDYESLAPIDSTTLLTMRHSMVEPNEILAVKGGEIKQLTNVNTALLSSIDMPKVVKRMVPTTDGKLMTTWVLYPADFDSTKTYPALLYCQGGPQSAVSQFFSYRWNLALMAAHGYIVIAPNRRGLPGFGTEWNAQISKDYGGQNMKDYLSAVDDMKRESYIDSKHIGAVGASYGGFSVYWLAGNHDGRFAAFVAHAGIFNTDAQYLETEEMWFANWDLGGPFWDKSNAAAQRSFANSPHRFVDKWDTPILVTHGEYDFRILASQGMMAFNAAKLRGIPAEMLIFPDENHWILKPQNSILWQRVFFRWLDRWLKPDAEQKQ
ncbi:S9 family peptidase [Paramuribaculum intestinale]|jgi:dipeptidyl aminopeptidase/acylaminoacyl peptidase|uniref:S9 family peptidase n=7 Tax=Paramuribaculum intestinale TaxID=2094151 RepID=UPI000F48C7B1|nr:S9 family peptidase [Paramuribaculum intestinale]MBJ2186806.1 S9 family peptidase [Muribaculaceae bacterium]ROS88912.1 S9 family peptidase [Muribaculaceae bacterium Isolate-043 (Harlan)]ROT15202.1 S9 family peptidase [Muribaculaceae bacterium Isolate-105 (HZI)]RXE61202.1 S9 family peptidase [Muribaculaceae bacterium Isolate-004 (NCI)]